MRVSKPGVVSAIATIVVAGVGGWWSYRIAAFGLAGSAAVGVGLAAGVYLLIHRIRARMRRKRDGADRPMTSLVLLQRKPRHLDDKMLRIIAAEALSADFPEDQENPDNFIVGAETIGSMMKYENQFYLINRFPRPYVKDVEEAAAAIAEQRLRNAFVKHCAWISVDAMFAESPDDKAGAYRVIGKMIAALADEDTLVIYQPESSQLAVFKEAMCDVLKSDDPLAVFASCSQPPMVEIADDDPDMLAAVSEARKRWPEFEAAFQKRRPDQMFSIKAEFRDGDEVEFIWVDVEAIENKIAFGRLGNDPLNVKTVKLGDRVRVRAENLNDWIYTIGKDFAGGFTVKVLQKKLSAANKQAS